MKDAGPAQREGWRVGQPIALLTGSAIVSDGTRSDTDRSYWDYPVRPDVFCELAKKICKADLLDLLGIPISNL